MHKTWYKKLGFSENPFSIKPAAFHNDLFGNESAISEITKKIGDSGVVFISGEFGTGKTTLLKKLISNLKGDLFQGKKVIYYNCNQSDKSIDYDKLLIDAGNFLGKLFRIRKKNMIILLDEMQDMNRTDVIRLKEYLEEDMFRLVILVAKYDNIGSVSDIEKDIEVKRFKLGNMSETEAVEMIRRRIGNIQFLPDKIIIEIFKKDQNSRNFLKNCEDVCRYVFNKSKQVVESEDVSEVLA